MTTNAEHHKRHQYCTTRLKYRQGRQLKAVKVINWITQLVLCILKNCLLEDLHSGK